MLMISKFDLAAFLLLAAAAAAQLPDAFGAADAKGDSQVKVIKAKPEVVEGEPWQWQAVLEPYDTIDRLFPAFEVQRVIGENPRHPHSVALAYWGTNTSVQPSNTSSGPPVYASNTTADPTVSVRDTYSLRGYSARFKLYPTRIFFVNSGVAAVVTHTKEDVTDTTQDTKFTVEKGATSLGFDIGVGTRWVLGPGITIGGTWFEAYFPLTVVKNQDAQVPDGYSLSRNGGGRKSDGRRPSIRVSALDIGYSF